MPFYNLRRTLQQLHCRDRCQTHVMGVLDIQRKTELSTLWKHDCSTSGAKGQTACIAYVRIVSIVALTIVSSLQKFESLRMSLTGATAVAGGKKHVPKSEGLIPVANWAGRRTEEQSQRKRNGNGVVFLQEAVWISTSRGRSPAKPVLTRLFSLTDSLVAPFSNRIVSHF
jgi:hypothetical protein